VLTGAVALEKHFTYRREGQTFHDHALSAEPHELTELVNAVRQAEVFRGKHVRSRGPSESKLLQHMRRSVAAAVDIPAGEVVRREWLTALRPAWGIPVERAELVVGAKLRRLVSAGDLIREEDLQR
jgi:N-acetylneuraminate synthase